MFTSKISRRFIGSFLFLALFSTAGFGIYLLHFFYTDHLEKQKAALENNARIIEISLASPLLHPESLPELSTKIAEISQATTLRITVIDATGKVLADSSESSGQLDNHLSRPEIQGALNHTQSTAIRYSHTLRENMLYVAIPVYDASGSLKGVVRTSTSLSPIEASYLKTRHTLLIALFANILLAIFLGILLARRQIRPIQQMIEDARCIGAGDLKKRLHIRTGDELESLGHTINQLTRSLAEKIAEAESTAHQQKLILENMDNGVLLLDAQGKILMGNTQAKNLFQLQPGHVGKSSISALGSTQLREAARSAVQQQKNQTFTFPLETTQGTKTFSVFVAPFPDQREARILCVFHDISLLQALTNRQAEFVANAAHELATPLTSISGFAETLLDDDFSHPEQTRNFLHILYEEAQRMSRLLQDLLQLARLESQDVRQSINLEEIDVQPLFSIVQNRLSRQAQQKKQEIRIQQEAAPAYIKANRDLLLQILMNLTENAIKYTPENGHILLTAYPKGSQFFFSIKDDGIGIPTESLPRIFERFYRVDKARKKGGSGIGLALVHFLVQIFGGEITVKSELHAGSEFILSFPLVSHSSGCVLPSPDK